MYHFYLNTKYALDIRILQKRWLIFHLPKNPTADRDAKSPFVRKERRAVEGIDGQTATSFLFVTFFFFGKRKSKDVERVESLTGQYRFPFINTGYAPA